MKKTATSEEGWKNAIEHNNEVWKWEHIKTMTMRGEKESELAEVLRTQIGLRLSEGNLQGLVRTGEVVTQEGFKLWLWGSRRLVVQLPLVFLETAEHIP